jgi:AcrR family transcriptional regulator
MTRQSKNLHDRRIKRTKTLVFEAFAELVVAVRYDELTTQQIIHRVGIGRSTFYDHFLDKDDVLGQSLSYPLSVLATAIIDKTKTVELMSILNHFWDRRTLVRVILQHPTRSIMENTLRQQLIERCDDIKQPSQIYAKSAYNASGFLTLLNEWVTGRVVLTAEEVATLMTTDKQ